MPGHMVTLELTKPQARALQTLLGWETADASTDETVEYLTRSQTRSLKAVLAKLEAVKT